MAYSALFEIAYEAQCIIDLDTENTHINEALRKIICTDKRVLPITEILEPKDWNKLKTIPLFTGMETELRINIKGQPLLCRVRRLRTSLLCSCSSMAAYNEIKNISIRHICHEMRNSIFCNDREEMLSLTQTLFTVSCIDKKNHYLRPRTYKLVPIINEVISKLPPHMCRIITKHIRNVSIIIDKERLQMILRNLLTNAIKYGNMSDIIIKSTQTNADFIISVIDHGVGMSAEQKDKLFRYFDNSCTEKGFSNHIGMPLTYDVANVMGLDIRVNSREGEGSEFMLIIPDKFIISHHISLRLPVCEPVPAYVAP